MNLGQYLHRFIHDWMFRIESRGMCSIVGCRMVDGVSLDGEGGRGAGVREIVRHVWRITDVVPSVILRGAERG